MKFLVIQTAFIGDVVLATGIIEKLHAHFPGSEIDFLVRKGNEALLKNHPYLHEVLIWEKNAGKLFNLWKLIREVRQRKYDTVINVQRFAATGILTAWSGAVTTIGFDKNPFSRFFTNKVPHVIGDEHNVIHEVARNNELIKDLTGNVLMKPRLYPSAADESAVRPYIKPAFITISPASVWFTKQYPKDKWVLFLDRVPAHYTVYVLGAPGDASLADEIIGRTSHPSVVNLCGKLSFLQSAALMSHAAMNYVNDSAPMHFASAVDAPVTAVYCSTLPSFGFGPLSSTNYIVEIQGPLSCRPCGLHGRPSCPLKHFKCAYEIREEQLLKTLPV